MSKACNMIKNYSERVSNNYEDCVKFVRSERDLNLVDPLEINECINEYCKKPSPVRNMRTSKYTGYGVDLSAGVF